VIRRARLALSLLCLLLPAAAAAQDPGEFLASGIRAYRDLEFDLAAGLLRRATASGDRLAAADLARGLEYLGATEVFRGERDSARAVFGRLVRLDPRYRLDALVFPPEVTGVFEGVRRTIRAVAVTLPDSAVFRSGQPGLVLDLFPSVLHEVRVEIQRPDGGVARTVYSGLLGDSLRVEWDGRVSGGATIPAGRYALVLTSLDPAGEPLRVVRVPLTVTLALSDTTPHPRAPADSLLLPERARSGPAIRAIVGGVGVGLAAAILPSVVASDAELSPARFVVGASIGVAGISAFLTRRPGRPLAANIAANDRVRAAWRAEVTRVALENEEATRRALVDLRLGPPQVVEREGT
jgi:hypothetical protein